MCVPQYYTVPVLNAAQCARWEVHSISHGHVREGMMRISNNKPGLPVRVAYYRRCTPVCAAIASNTCALHSMLLHRCLLCTHSVARGSLVVPALLPP